MKEKEETRCIICGNERNGIEIRSDSVITAIRWLKKNITKNEKGYKLVVCKECYPKYAKERKKFKNRQAFYVGLGIVFDIVLLYGARNSGYIGIVILYCIAILVFVYLLSLLTYIPELNIPVEAKAADSRGKAH